MRMAYADPPYFGCGKHYAAHHPNALDWDRIETHKALIDRLMDEFRDGWAMSLSSTSLHVLLPLCPTDVRISAWVKPFAVFKPNVNPAYAWEPVIWRGGRPRTREQDTARDWVAANITLQRGLVGAKPRDFCVWVLQLLNVEKGDEFVDLFPGTSAMQAAFDQMTGEIPAALELTL